MTSAPVRERLAAAAFELFDERGFDQTTVTDIAERAGVGRTTVFRSFQSKEDLIFPDHDRLLAIVRDRLAASTTRATDVAVFEALAVVLRYYTSEGERARSRYRLTRSVPALAAREAASVRLYKQAFAGFFQTVLDGGRDAALRAELAGSAVVTAHNHVLRRWLRGQSDDPETELKPALDYAMATLREQTGGSDVASILLVRTDRSVDDVFAALQRTLGPDGISANPTNARSPRRRTNS
jgi:AcrR family transcriptional regulator